MPGSANGGATHTPDGFVELHRRELAEQARALHVARVLVYVACLAVLLVYEEGAPRAFRPAYVVVTLAIALAAVELALLPRARRLDGLIRWSVVGDAVLATVLAYLTGGVYNLGFAFLYFAAILAAVLLVSERFGLALASLATVALSLIAIAYYLASEPGGIELPLVAPDLVAGFELQRGRVTANLIGAMLAFHGVAVLAAQLPQRVSDTRLLYEDVIDRMREGLVAIDKRGVIVVCNPEACRLLAWGHPGGLVGQHFQEALRRREDRAVIDILARGVDVQAELTLQPRGREALELEVRTSVLRDQGGAVRGVVGVFRDLSLVRRLSEAERQLSRLAGTEEAAMGIAHEIRTPIASIRGAVQELVAGASDESVDRRLAGIVRRETDRLDRLLQQFLDFARMPPPVLARLEVWSLVDETVELLRRRADAADVVIECPPCGPFEVEGDADLLRQALLNIGVNGLEALGGRGRLRFGAAPVVLPRRVGAEERVLESRPGVAVEVENDGPPIPDDVAERIFTPFVSTKRGGLGLGLAITQKIVGMHGGTISADRGGLGGARFRLLLPLVAPLPAEGGAAEPARRKA